MAWKYWLSCLALIACSNSGTSSSEPAARSCDPLSVAASPITLGAVVGAGRASDGTVYLIDKSGGTTRVFVSQGTVLRRRNNLGEGGSADSLLVMLANDLQVRVTFANSVAVRMELLRGEPEPATKAGGQPEELTLVPASELGSFTLQNISPIYVAYAARTDDGRELFVFEPRIDLKDDTVRAYFGPRDRVQQRKVLNVSRDHAVHLTFDLDGVATQAELVQCRSPVWGPPVLRANGVTTPLTPLPGSFGECTAYHDAIERGDAGPDAGPFPASPPRAEASELTAGSQFYCF